MDRHRRILRPDGLGFVAEQFDACLCEYLRSAFRNGRLPLHEDAFRRPLIAGLRLKKHLLGVLRRDVALRFRHIGISDEFVKTHLLDGLSAVHKMVRRVHMGAVMCAHLKRRQVAHGPVRDAKHHLPLGTRVPRIHTASEHFLGNIINLHTLSSLCYKNTGTPLPGVYQNVGTSNVTPFSRRQSINCL